MTREEKIKILAEAQERAFKQIDLTEGCEMGTEEFSRLLNVAQSMEWMVAPDTDVTKPEAFEPTVPDQVQHAPVEPETVPEQVQSETAATMTKEEVRDKLSTYSNKYDALDVASIMNDMGYGKLSDIPATRYGELLERVEAAVKEFA